MKKYNIVIVGGGSTFTPGFLKSFCRMQKEFPLNKLVLFDIDGERQKPIGEFGKLLFQGRILLYDRYQRSIYRYGFCIHANACREICNA